MLSFLGEQAERRRECRCKEEGRQEVIVGLKWNDVGSACEAMSAYPGGGARLSLLVEAESIDTGETRRSKSN